MLLVFEYQILESQHHRNEQWTRYKIKQVQFIGKSLRHKGVDQKREVGLPERVLLVAYVGALGSGVKLGNEEEASCPRIVIWQHLILG